LCIFNPATLDHVFDQFIKFHEHLRFNRGNETNNACFKPTHKTKSIVSLLLVVVEILRTLLNFTQISIPLLSENNEPSSTIREIFNIVTTHENKPSSYQDFQPISYTGNISTTLEEISMKLDENSEVTFSPYNQWKIFPKMKYPIPPPV